VPYEKYIEDNILKPLGMSHSGFINESSEPQFPVGYVYASLQEEPLIAPKWQMGAASYTGGMYSTAEDLAKLVSLQFQESPVGGPQILSADGLRAMRLTTGDYSGPDYSAGIGWWGNHVGGHHIITHNGGHLGFMATASAMPDMKLGVVVLTNRCNPMSDMQTAQLARRVFEVLVPRLGMSEQLAPFDPAKIDFQRYAGTYTVVGGASQISIQVENGMLYQTVLDAPAPRMQLFPAAQEQFSHAPGQPAVVTFESDSGRITGLSFALFRFRRAK
jgi:CubicO group peptidase (beta-lactamase class C family)